MSNLLEQWKEHEKLGNLISKDIEHIDKAISSIADGWVAFYQGDSVTYLEDYLADDQLIQLRNQAIEMLGITRQKKTIELEQLLGLVPVIPPLAQGGVLVADTGCSQYFKVEKDPPEVILPGERKPATINPEFEAATKDMFESVKKIDPVEESLKEVLKAEADRIEQPEKSLDKCPAKKSNYPENMTEEAVRKLYQEDGKTIKQIAEHFGVKSSTVNNFIYLRGLKRSSKPVKQPEETERP